MRVLMGEVIDTSSDLTTKHLTVSQKISVLWQSLLAESKILGNKKKAEEAKKLQERNDRIDRLKDGLLASLEFHLTSNRTLAESNEEAEIVQLAVDRTNKDIIDVVLESHEFNSYECEFVEFDADMINSFGNAIPIVISFRQKGVL